MELIQNMSWTEPFPFCSSIADLNGPDLPEISNEQACAKTTRYTAPFVPSAAPNNHYALSENMVRLDSRGPSLFPPLEAHVTRDNEHILNEHESPLFLQPILHQLRITADCVQAHKNESYKQKIGPGKRGMGHIRTAPSIKVAPNRKPVFEDLLCVQTRWKRYS
ncbi:hypothetical protein PG999_005545 [Apiospora kogelbergensis]|uniref:Uncharacterized protein n=1 Tax=Apiospora kogelbergensis TaxID=1337665 RepID=A0AAW0R2F7_9PEZI